MIYAALVFLAFQPCPIYMISVEGLCYAGFFIGMAIMNPGALRGLLRPGTYARGRVQGAGALLILYCIVYYASVKLSLRELFIVKAGRTASGAVDIATFLGYGIQLDWRSLATFLAYPMEFAMPSKGTTDYLFELSLYLGYLTLGFAILAIVYARKKELYALAVTAFMMAVFSLGSTTFFAGLTYKVIPLMDYARNIYAASSFLKVLIPLMAGYGVEMVIEGWPRYTSRVKASVLALIYTLYVLGLIAYLSAIWRFIRQYAAGNEKFTVNRTLRSSSGFCWPRVWLWPFTIWRPGNGVR